MEQAAKEGCEAQACGKASMITSVEFWAGIAVLVGSMWIRGVALEKEFIKRMTALIDAVNKRDS